MYTRCPDCHRVHPISVAQLRQGRGLMPCWECGETFDALIFLSETENITPIEPLAQSQWSKDSKKDPKKNYWLIGTVLGMGLLLFQWVYFEGYSWTQQPSTRVWLEKAAEPIGLTLPPYRNLNEFEVLHRSLTPDGKGQYQFKVLFSNQAAFRQAYPNVELTLLDFAGIPFGHRILKPEHYLRAQSPGSIDAGASIEINLTIAQPERQVGGFDFHFVD